MLSYFYAKSAAVVLAVTFALHLLLRAQWIALVGMHSVFPQGIRLERMKMGPIQRVLKSKRRPAARKTRSSAPTIAPAWFSRSA